MLFRSNSTVPDPVTCIGCRSGVDLAEIYFCHGCKGERYCPSCQVKHFDGRHSQLGTPYEVYQQVEAVLSTVEDEPSRHQMHHDNSLARWIGITMPDGTDKAQPSLCGYSRVVNLLSNNNGPETQLPSLVSFTGLVGPGKVP